ncbi:MAG: hypothetical protein KKH75_04675, partial [Actinobacteria bacterium]|nr:hypothetical protein [Actinomycetota bacterium]
MTDASGSGLPPTDVAAGTPSGGASRLILTIATKIPVTLSIVALLLIVGVASAGLWSPFELSSAWDVFAYGLPAFEAGRWWTPVTGTFFVNQPWVYALTITSFWGLAYLEYRRGSRVALAYFTIGQLFSVLATAVILWVFALTPWPWAQLQSQMLDVGPSGGAFAGIAAAVGLFVAPWRVRGWAVLLSFLFVALVFWGNIADLSHVLAVVLVLAVDRTLRVRRTTMREQRLIAYLALLVLGAIEILALLLPTNGPFGSSASGSGSIWDVALDVVVIVLVANGLRHGRRWAWVVSVILAIVNLLTGALILLVVALAGWDETRTGLDGDPTVSLASSATWLLMFAYLIWVRGAFRPRRKASVGTKPGPTVDEVKNELR